MNAARRSHSGLVSLSESLLLARHVKGDPLAFAELVDRYKAPIYGYICRTGVSEADRDDVFQDVFLKVHRNAHRYSPEKPLRPWLFTVAINVVRSHFRRHVPRTEEPSDQLASRAPTPLAIAAAHQTAAWLDAEIAKMALPLREALVLCCVEGVDQSAAALALDVPLNTLKTRLRRARLHLAGRPSPTRCQNHAGGLMTTPTCDKIQTLILEEGAAAFEESADVRSHVVGCETCLSRLEALEALDAELAELPPLSPSVALVENLLARVADTAADHPADHPADHSAELADDTLRSDGHLSGADAAVYRLARVLRSAGWVPMATRSVGPHRANVRASRPAARA